jgi:DNA polymerase III alpha subunit
LSTGAGSARYCRSECARSTDTFRPAEARDLNLNLADRRLKLTLELARQLIGTPRHLSQHPGGFVLTQDRLDELVPIEPAATMSPEPPVTAGYLSGKRS